jgi:predicted phage tail protein
MISWKYSMPFLAALVAASCSPAPAGKATDLAASEVNDLSLTLTWKDGANGEVRYSVERSEISEGTGFNPVGTLVPDSTSFRDQSVQPLTSYWYRVAAVFVDGSRTVSNTVKATTQKPILVPVAPTMFTAKGFTENDVELTWSDNSSNETGFELERGAPDAGTFTKVATLDPDLKKHTDTGLTKDTSYVYRLRSFNSAGASPYTLPATAKTYITNDMLAPSVPADVVAVADSSTSITITWTASTDDISGIASYRILQNTIEVASIPAANVTHTATLLGSGAMYCFQVAAVDVVGNRSLASTPPACATTPTTTTGPNAPAGVTATTVSYQQINVRWVDAANDENGFYIERSLTSAAGYSRIASVGRVTDGGGLYPDDAGLLGGTVYYYRMRAHNDAGTSAPSMEASTATLPTPPEAPSAFAAMAQTANTIRLTWMDNSMTEAGFSIDQSTMPDAGFVAITQTGANAVNFTPQTLSPGTTYYYRMRAFNLGGSSATLGPISATTFIAPNAPTMADAGAIAATQMTITWQDNSADELGFRIERALAANGPYAQLTKPDGGVPAVLPDVESYVATGLTAATRYFFRVRALGDAGFSNATQATGLTLP